MRVILMRVSCAQLARTKTCRALLLVLLVRLELLHLGLSLEQIRSLQSGLRERMIFLYVYVHPELKPLVTDESKRSLERTDGASCGTCPQARPIGTR